MAFSITRPAPRMIVSCAGVAVLATAYLTGALLRWGVVPYDPSTIAEGVLRHSPHGHAGPGRNELAAFMGDFGLAGAAAAAAVSCAVRAIAARGRLRGAWLLFSASALTAALGNAVWGWYELVLQHEPPTPSAADWIFLFFAPFAMAGTLVHHRGPGGSVGWVKLLLDGAMIAGAIFCAGWSPALAREALDGGGSPLRVTLSLAYPVFDILLVSLVLALRFRGGGRRDGASMATLLAAYTTIVVSDAIWTIPAVRAGYASGGLLDSCWFLGYLLLVVAPWMSVWSAPSRPKRDRSMEHSTEHGVERSVEQAVDALVVPPAPAAHPREPFARPSNAALGLLGLLFPYVVGAVCLAGIMANGLTGDHQVRPAVLAAGGTVLAALVARQAVTLLENRALTRQLAVREDHFRSLVQGSSDVITTMDPRGRFGYISPAVEHVFGYRPDELVGRLLYDFVHPDDRDDLRGAVADYLAGPGASAGVECRIRSVLGGTIAFADAASPESPPEHSIAQEQETSDCAAPAAAERWRHAECTLTRHRGGLVFTCRDVSDRVELQRKLAHSAYHDALTGLPNRAFFTNRLEHALAQPAAVVRPIAVLFLDLDWFKQVNDAGGHAVGDLLLTRVAARLRAAARSADLVARFGGDEFAALVQGGTGERAAREVAARFHSAISRPFNLPAGRFTVGASIGVAFWRTGASVADLMREADLAMYEAKAGGKRRIVVRAATAPVGTPAHTPHLSASASAAAHAATQAATHAATQAATQSVAPPPTVAVAVARPQVRSGS
jgi:diguanylate cyclase (GGDEF)-like protein/PAS domain S-box-containing protein